MKVSRRFGVLVLVAMGSLLAPGAVAQADAAAFSPLPGTYTVDTTALTLTGPGTNIPGADEGGIAVFGFDSVNILPGVTIEVEGSRPFELRSAGAFTLAGLIEGSGVDAKANTAGPNAGGPGGGAGGADGSQAGVGPGGGGIGSASTAGGGGGGFGGAGAAGGEFMGIGGAKGAAYGNLSVALQGGSGGAGGSTSGSLAGGGGGGGGVKLTAASLTIAATGQVLVDGGNGNSANQGASGGGSGGGIVLRADTIDVSGLLSAEGGDGGTGGCCGDGGGGGGGRILYQYRTLTNPGTASVAGGASGKSGALTSNHPSVDPTGAPGVITKSQAASATTNAATKVSVNGATLNGTVNPNGSTTTYRFEYGTSTAYGTSRPVPNGSVGSDSAAHALSLLVSRLKPKTTFHYRIVAVDQLGFTTFGADATFTTKPFSGAEIRSKTVRVKKGFARVKLSSKAACKGKLKLTAKVKGAAGKGRAKNKTLGSAKFSLGTGKARIVKVHLSSLALELLEEDGSLKATAAASAAAFGAKKTTKRKVTLKPAKGAQPGKH